jgi:hypothetical protein
MKIVQKHPTVTLDNWRALLRTHDMAGIKILSNPTAVPGREQSDFENNYNEILN